MAGFRLSEIAKEDLVRIYRYTHSKFGEKQADRYYHELFAEFQFIASNPQLFMRVDHRRKGYRRCVFGAHSIYFREGRETVDIMTIVGREDIHLL